MATDSREDTGDGEGRIAELEQEVARLGDAPGPEDRVDGDVPMAEAERLVPKTNRLRIVGISTVVVVVALGVMFAIFQAISAGIDSVAPSAAGFFSPDEQDAEAAPNRPPPPPQEDPPRVPGL